MTTTFKELTVRQGAPKSFVRTPVVNNKRIEYDEDGEFIVANNVPKTHDKKENVYEYTLSGKSSAIVVLIVLLSGFMLHAYLFGGRERLISEKEDLKYDNFVTTSSIERLNKRIENNNFRITEVDKELKEKYKTIYN